MTRKVILILIPSKTIDGYWITKIEGSTTYPSNLKVAKVEIDIKVCRLALVSFKIYCKYERTMIL